MPFVIILMKDGNEIDMCEGYDYRVEAQRDCDHMNRAAQYWYRGGEPERCGTWVVAERN